MKKRADGRWVKTVTINGKRKMFYSRAKTQKQAESEIIRQMTSYQETETTGKTLKEVTDEWEKSHYKTLAYTTAHRYEQFAKTFNDYFGDIHIKQISSIDIEYFMQYLSERGYSSKTIRDQLCVIKMIFKYAIIHRYINNNPAAYISPSKGAPPKTRDALNDNEIKIVQESIDCSFGLLAYFLLYTGLRKGEALALQWKDIDFKNKVIHVTKSVYFESNTPYIKKPKTATGLRDVLLLDCLASKLNKGQPDEYVFGNKDKIINKSYFTRQWEKYKKESGLNITAHQLRHTFATILFEADIKEKDAQILMGHSDIRVTQNIYTHIRQNRLPETAEKLNHYIKEMM